MDTATAGLAQEMLEARARRAPAWATQVGLPGHDGRVRDSRMEAYLDELDEVEAFLARAERLAPSPEREMLLATLGLEKFHLAVERNHVRNPDLAVEYFDHLFALLTAAHLSPAQLGEALVARLEAAPRFFRDGWDRFDPEDVPAMWVAGALKTVESSGAFLDAVRAFGAQHPLGPALSLRLARALGDAEGALAEHAAWLRELHPRARGRVALGGEAFAQLLQLRHVRDSPAELTALGERLVARFQEELREAAVTVLAQAGREPGADAVAEALDIMRADHPATFGDVLRFHGEAIAEARAFVVARGLARMTEVPLEVVETPTFLRHLIPFAAYHAPARFASPRRGVYLVTPKADLRAFPREDVRNTVVHEAFPGHHLHLATVAEHASLPAFLLDAPDLVEGWALYCEAMMGEQGHTASPAARLVRARDALWRALRIVLDVGIHTGRLTPEEAARMLSRETGMDAEDAEAEVLRYTQSPAYNLSYMWGRVRLEELRARHLAAGGSLRTFHDAVLRAGTIPVAMLDAAGVRR